MNERFSIATVTPVMSAEGADPAPVLSGDAVALREYSGFKYGDGKAARFYGAMMAELALTTRPDLLENDIVYVTSSAYKIAPPAAHSLQAPFVDSASRIATDREAHTRFVPFKINRGSLTHGDYAGMSLAERERVMTNNGLSLQEGIDLHDGPVVVLDDIYVTGSHERAIHQVLMFAGVESAYYGYILSVHDGVSHPRIEAVINATAIGSVKDIVNLAQRPDFIPNARLCKYVLSLTIDDLAYFCSNVPDSIVQQLVSYIEGDQLPAMTAYGPGYNRLMNITSR